MPTKLEAYLKLDTGAHSAFIRFLIPVPDSHLLISGGADKTIRIWDLDAQREVKKILGQIAPGQAGELVCAQITPNGNYLIVSVSWSPDGTQREETLLSNLRIYNLITGNLERELIYSSYITDMRLTPDGQYLVLCSHVNSEIEVYHLDDFRTVKEPVAVSTMKSPLDEQPRRLAVTQLDDIYAIVCGVWGKGGLQYYSFDGKQLTLMGTVTLMNGQMPYWLAMSNEYVAMSGNILPELEVYDLAGKLVKRVGKELLPTDGLPGYVEFSADGKRLVLGSRREASPSSVLVFDATSKFSLASTYRGHDMRPEVVAFLPNGDVVSASGTDNAIHVWDASKKKGQQKVDICGHGQVVFGVGVLGENLVGIGNTSDLITDPNDISPLERVFDLDSLGIAPLTAAEAADFTRALPVYKKNELTLDGTDLWLEPAHTLVTNAKDSWYITNTYGFTPAGTIIIGDSDGNVRVGRRSANGKYPPRPWSILPAHTAALLDHAVGEKWLVTAGVDQVIRLWSMEAIEERELSAVTPALNLFVSKDNEWVLWSESGFYTASEDGDKFIGYHINQGVGQEALFYSSDRFIKQLYRPDIIRAIVDTGNEARALKAMGLKRTDIVSILPPVIEAIGSGLRINNMQAELDFEVRRASKPVSRVWVLVDDKPAWDDRTERENKSGKFHLKLPVTPGRHRIKILAQSDTAKSNPLIADLVATPLRKIEESSSRIAFGEALDAEAPPPPPAQLAALTLSGVVNTAKHKTGLSLRRNGEQVWESTNPGDFNVVIPLGEGDSDIVLQTGQGETAATLATIRVSRPQQPTQLLSLDLGSARGSDSHVESDLTTIPPNLYIMAVGVSTLQHPEAERGFGNLKYAHLDAQEIVTAFQAQKGKQYGDVVSRLLMNEDATRERILSDMDALWKIINTRAEDKAKNKQQAADVTLLFLSGHGLDYNGDFYFWNYDLSLADPGKTGLRMLDLGERITSVPTELIVMTDACRAGMVGSEVIRAIDPLELAKRLRAINERAQFIISATRKDTLSWEHDSLKHGIFTMSALEGLSSATTDVTLMWLTDFIQRKVALRTGGKQVPVARAYGDMMGLLIYKK